MVNGTSIVLSSSRVSRASRLGCVKPEDAPWIVGKLINDLKAQGARPLRVTERPFSMAHWRGRMGMTQGEMKSLYAAFEPRTNLS